MSRVNIFLEEELHSRLKIVAVLKKETLNQFIEDAVQRMVERDRHLIVTWKRGY